MKKALCAACAGILAVSLAGCGKTGLVAISGAVAYEGKPVSHGAIRFLSVDGAGPTAATVIADGKYAVNTLPGKKRVEIEAFRVIGQRHRSNDPRSPLIDIHEQVLPEKYNAYSTLTAEIETANRVYDFALQK